MNEKTFRRLFPKVKLSVCPYEIQNFGNSTADISILGQFHVYLQFRGEKYLTTFIVTNADEIATEFPNRERVEHAGHFPTHMEMCMDDHLTRTTERTQQQHLQDKTSKQSCSTHSILPDFTFSHAEFPPGMENTPVFSGNQFLQGKEKNMDTGTFTLGNIILNR